MNKQETNIITDEEILRLFKKEASRETAFRLLTDTYGKKLYWHIRKLVIDHSDADDILQETLVKVWQHLHGFREDAKLYTWLYRIATNESLNFLKKKKRRFTFSFHDTEAELARKLDDPGHFTGNEIEKKLQKAILRLPEKQRVVFNLKYFEEMKYEVMSEILATSVGALKASYHHAVKKIKKYVSED